MMFIEENEDVTRMYRLNGLNMIWEWNGWRFGGMKRMGNEEMKTSVCL
ncbi:hypothetical protein Hanom_Chr08g00692881 [Helianthus anomalus]